MYKKTRLENGLRVVTHSMPRMQSVACGIWLRVGGRYESSESKGIAHFLEHLLFKGTRKYSCRRLKESIEGVGGALNGFTSEEFTCYLVKIPARHLALALDILSDMVKNPLLKEEEIAKEKTVIIEEIKMYKDLPQSYVHELLDELLWPGHPLGLSIAGTTESVGRLGKKDLVSFKERYYTPANIVISAAGALSHQLFVRDIKKRFASCTDKKIEAFLPVRGGQHKPQLKIFHKETEQAHLAMGFEGVRRDHPLRYALGLLHTILGANMSSRLFNELREKRGLAYEIGTQMKYFHDTGAFIVNAGMDNNKVEEVLSLILKELEKTKKSTVSAGELKRAKEFYFGQLLLALEDTLDQMLWIGESTAALDKTYNLKEVMKEVNKISLTDIRQVARSIFKEERLNLALIGPLENSQKAILSRLHIA